MEIVLNAYGSKLSMHQQNFQITTDEVSHIVPSHGLNTIYVWKSTRISSDAILFALQHDIDIVFMDHFGNVQGRIWNCKFGSTATVRKGQLLFCQSQAGVEWTQQILKRKVDAQRRLLEDCLEVHCGDDLRQTRTVARALRKLQLLAKRLDGFAVSNQILDCDDALRGIEGTASRTYFQAVAAMLPRHLEFEKRQQRPSYDVVNAMLNYAYAILYNKVETALIKAGIDPAIGLLHSDNYNTPVFSFDMIEPYRFVADTVVFDMALSGEVDKNMGHYVEESQAFMLDTPLRKELASRVLAKLKGEDEEDAGVNHLYQLRLETQRLAQIFKSFYKKHKDEKKK